MTYRWADIVDCPELREIYPEDATDASSIPFPIRNALGDFLIDATAVRLKTLGEKKLFNQQIVSILREKRGMRALWIRWMREPIFEPIGRTHTQHSFYLVIWTNMQLERKYAPKFIERHKCRLNTV